MDSEVLPIHRVPVVVLTIDILPFHFGFKRSSRVFGASAGGMIEVLNPKLVIGLVMANIIECRFSLSL